jgi:hypothetical protein
MLNLSLLLHTPQQTNSRHPTFVTSKPFTNYRPTFTIRTSGDCTGTLTTVNVYAPPPPNNNNKCSAVSVAHRIALLTVTAVWDVTWPVLYQLEPWEYVGLHT